MVEVENGETCCCGAKRCALIFAYIKFGYTMYVILDALKTIYLGEIDPASFQNYNENPDALLKFNPYTVLAVAVSELTLYITLLIGIHMAKPVCLTVWLILLGMVVGMRAFLIFVSLFLAKAEQRVQLLFIAIPPAFTVFGIWVVSEYRIQMIRQQRLGTLGVSHPEQV